MCRFRLCAFITEIICQFFSPFRHFGVLISFYLNNFIRPLYQTKYVFGTCKQERLDAETLLLNKLEEFVKHLHDSHFKILQSIHTQTSELNLYLMDSLKYSMENVAVLNNRSEDKKFDLRMLPDLCQLRFQNWISNELSVGIQFIITNDLCSYSIATLPSIKF